jgi:hypothetical protein
MMRIKLAAWYGDKAPGDVIDGDEATVKALRRDGLVAEILGAEESSVPEPVDDIAEAEIVAPETGRRKR